MPKLFLISFYCSQKDLEIHVLNIGFIWSFLPERGDKLEGDMEDDGAWCAADGGDVDDDLEAGDTARDGSGCDVTSFVMKFG